VEKARTGLVNSEAIASMCVSTTTMASPMLIRCSTGLGGARPSSLRASRPGAASSGSSVRPLGLCNGVLHNNKLSR
jgi:hypothetical protein